MVRTLPKLALLVAAFSLFLAPLPGSAQSTKKTKKKRKLPQREISNYNDGVWLETDGGVGDNTCFKLNGHLFALDFFDHLIRVDGNSGAEFLRGDEPVTQFPDHLLLSFTIHDLPCSSQLQKIGTRIYLTPQIMSTLHLSMYWKRGIELRPVDKPLYSTSSVEPVAPFAAATVHDLPEKFAWNYKFAIPSSGVPLTDSLVLILRTPDGRIAARVAARM